ncbi:hypothetical protein ACM9XA_03500 [Xanthomonas sacchari]
MQKINPEWVKFNNLFNEGYTDSYNPHPKYITVAAAAPVAAPAASSGKVYRDSRGMPIDPAAKIAEESARLEGVTDAFARELIEKSIANYRKMLEC